MLSFIRRRRAFAKFVLWILIAIISIGLIAWYGSGPYPRPLPSKVPHPDPDSRAAPNS